MKKIFTTLSIAALLILAACGSKNAINNDDLQGRYQMDISSLVKDIIAEQNDKMMDFLASMFISQVEITVIFESETIILDASNSVSDFVKSASKGKVSLPMSVEYKIENDSVLYFKPEGKEFEEVGVLKKLGDSYDYLKFISTKDDRKVEVSLKKIK